MLYYSLLSQNFFLRLTAWFPKRLHLDFVPIEFSLSQLRCSQISWLVYSLSHAALSKLFTYIFCRSLLATNNIALQKSCCPCSLHQLPLCLALPFLLWDMSLMCFSNANCPLYLVLYLSIGDTLQVFYIHFTWHFLLSSKYH